MPQSGLGLCLETKEMVMDPASVWVGISGQSAGRWGSLGQRERDREREREKKKKLSTGSS